MKSPVRRRDFLRLGLCTTMAPILSRTAAAQSYPCCRHPGAVGRRMAFIKAAKIRALAVTSGTRAAVLADVPTAGEFVPGYEASQWFGIVAPKSTRLDIVDKLNSAINEGLADPPLKTRLEDLG